MSFSFTAVSASMRSRMKASRATAARISATIDSDGSIFARSPGSGQSEESATGVAPGHDFREFLLALSQCRISGLASLGHGVTSTPSRPCTPAGRRRPFPTPSHPSSVIVSRGSPSSSCSSARAGTSPGRTPVHSARPASSPPASIVTCGNRRTTRVGRAVERLLRRRVREREGLEDLGVDRREGRSVHEPSPKLSVTLAPHAPSQSLPKR